MDFDLPVLGAAFHVDQVAHFVDVGSDGANLVRIARGDYLEPDDRDCWRGRWDNGANRLSCMDAECPADVETSATIALRETLASEGIPVDQPYLASFQWRSDYGLSSIEYLVMAHGEAAALERAAQLAADEVPAAAKRVASRCLWSRMRSHVCRQLLRDGSVRCSWHDRMSDPRG